jgi:hypothetical protein
VIYGLEAAGGAAAAHGRAAAVALLVTADAVHRARRDALTGMLTARGLSPPAALPGYLVPQLGTGAAAVGFAAALEDATATGYREAVATLADPPLRRFAATALADAAVRASRLRATLGLPAALILQALPGTPSGTG